MYLPFYFPLLIILYFCLFVKHYPNAIANAVASSAAVAVVATVPALLGSVKVISDVDEGPIKVTLFVPLSLSSKNSKNPAEVAPFFNCIPAFAIGVVNVGVVKVLFVSVAVDAVETKSTSPPVLGSVKVLEALSECGAACSVCA
jgi:hypothetical protein